MSGAFMPKLPQARPELHLYVDDSGSRDLNKAPTLSRNDGMDYFALGGILIDEKDIDGLLTTHKLFCDAHNIDYPLHSWAIRGGREKFGWLKNPEKAFAFYTDLESFLVGLPVIGIAAVVDRPGYIIMQQEKCQAAPVPMAKSAFGFLIERAAMFADSRQCSLRVFFERAGKAEDRSMILYMRDLKKFGMPFDGTNADADNSLTAQDFCRIVMGEPRGRTKETPMIQVADLMLYPMAKGGYDPDYRAYVSLLKAGKLIDALFDAENRTKLGIKYSCFEKNK
jgi:Protein of unknown function (DUF3800)